MIVICFCIKNLQSPTTKGTTAIHCWFLQYAWRVLMDDRDSRYIPLYRGASRGYGIVMTILTGHPAPMPLLAPDGQARKKNFFLIIGNFLMISVLEVTSASQRGFARRATFRLFFAQD
jgi:hypothetical protein